MKPDGTGAQRACHRVLRLTTIALVAVLWLASGCESAGVQALAIGDHEVHVGEPWRHVLRCEGGVEPVTWQVVEGPAGIAVVSRSETALVWTATAHDLGGQLPGQARNPGPRRPIRVRVTDATGAKATASGSVTAVPTPAKN